MALRYDDSTINIVVVIIIIFLPTGIIIIIIIIIITLSVTHQCVLSLVRYYLTVI